MSFKMLNSTKKDGNMSYKYGNENEVYKNRVDFFEGNNIKLKNTLAINVDYKDNIFVLNDDFILNNKDLSKVTINTDCIVTNIKDIFVYLPFGDCIPLGIYDLKNEIMAFAHMGWQSTELKLHIKIIDFMIKQFNSQIENLQVIIGPSIKKESYILKNPSQLKYKDWKQFLNHIGNDMYEIDLNGYIVNGLKKLGIDKIDNYKIDTAKDLNYYSHYRSIYINKSESEGRFICGTIIKSDN